MGRRGIFFASLYLSVCACVCPPRGFNYKVCYFEEKNLSRYGYGRGRWTGKERGRGGGGITSGIKGLL